MCCSGCNIGEWCAPLGAGTQLTLHLATRSTCAVPAAILVSNKLGTSGLRHFIFSSTLAPCQLVQPRLHTILVHAFLHPPQYKCPSHSPTRPSLPSARCQHQLPSPTASLPPSSLSPPSGPDIGCLLRTLSLTPPPSGPDIGCLWRTLSVSLYEMDMSWDVLQSWMRDVRTIVQAELKHGECLPSLIEFAIRFG